MIEDELLRALPLADRLRIAVADLAVIGALGAGGGGVAGGPATSRTKKQSRHQEAAVTDAATTALSRSLGLPNLPDVVLERLNVSDMVGQLTREEEPATVRQ